MRKSKIFSNKATALVVAILMIGLLAACSLPLPGANEPTATEAPVAQPSSEPAPSGPTASFGGVSFSLDPAIAAAANGAAMPDSSDPTAPPEFDKGPARIAFSFDGYTGSTATIPALVYVYNAADLAGTPEEPMANSLATLLQERPDLAGQQQLPFLPTVNAGQGLHAREAYRDFAGGSGIEYIAMYAQGPSPITSDQLWYVFQGVTSDGQSYVSAVFPLNTDLFPAEIPADFNYDEWFAGYDQYIADSRKALADAPVDRFTPAIDKLGALVQSITVTPGQADAAAPTAAEAPATPAEPATANLSGTYTATLPAADTPGRAMILTLNPDGSATMSTDYLNGQPAIVETGTWQVNDDGTVTTSFTQVGENILATPDVITFAQQDNALVAVEFDPEAYGSEGLTLVKSGEAAAGAPTPAEGVPADGATPAAPAEPVAPVEPAVPAKPAAPAEITGVTWQLQEISRGSGSVSPVADPTKYTLTLNADGTVAIVADCNTGAGTYEVDGSAISFQQLATTRMACPQPSMGSQFTKVLGFADSYAVENGNLVLSYSNGGGTLTFTPAGQ